MATKQVLYGLLALFVVLVLWQHVGWVANVDHGHNIVIPSHLLLLVANFVEYISELCGILFARLSSILYHLKQLKFLRSMWPVFDAIFRICTGCIYFMQGYFVTAETYSDPYVIFLGSLCLFVMVGLGGRSFRRGNYKAPKKASPSIPRTNSNQSFSYGFKKSD